MIVLPDYVREAFLPGTDQGGHDAGDGRGFRYLEWRWDPDPADDTYVGRPLWGRDVFVARPG